MAKISLNSRPCMLFISIFAHFHLCEQEWVSELILFFSDWLHILSGLCFHQNLLWNDVIFIGFPFCTDDIIMAVIPLKNSAEHLLGLVKYIEFLWKSLNKCIKNGQKIQKMFKYNLIQCLYNLALQGGPKMHDTGVLRSYFNHELILTYLQKNKG